LDQNFGFLQHRISTVVPLPGLRTRDSSAKQWTVQILTESSYLNQSVIIIMYLYQ